MSNHTTSNLEVQSDTGAVSSGVTHPPPSGPGPASTALQNKILLQAQASNLEDSMSKDTSIKTNISEINETNKETLADNSINNDSQLISDTRRPLVIDTGTPSYNTENNSPTDTTNLETRSLLVDGTSTDIAPLRNENQPTKPIENTTSSTATAATATDTKTTVNKYQSITDDFFSLYTPTFGLPEPKKKKKKKVKKAKSETTVEPAAESTVEAVPGVETVPQLEIQEAEPEVELVELGEEHELEPENQTANDTTISDNLGGGEEDEALILNEEEPMQSPMLARKNTEELDSVNVVQEFTDNKNRNNNKRKATTPVATDTPKVVKAVKIPSFTDYKRFTTSTSSSSNNNYNSNDDDDEYLEDDLLRKLKTHSAMPKFLRQSTAGSATSEDSTSASATTASTTETPDRIYSLKIKSNLPGSENQELQVRSKGSKQFQSILKKTLKYLVTQRNLQGLQLLNHTMDRTVLLWKQTHEISPYMKPENLNIPANPDGSDAVIELDLYTKEQTSHLEKAKREQLRLEKEQKKKDEAMDQFLTQLQKQKEEEERLALQRTQEEEEEALGLLNEDDLKILSEVKSKEHSVELPMAQNPEVNNAAAENEEDGYFKIFLKSADNEKLTVQVNFHTRLSKLAAYFLEKKGLPADSKIRFVFDDEPLDLDSAVGDTELEEDFSIDVYVDK